MRHGKGIQFELSDDGTPVKVYEGRWDRNMRQGYGTSFKISNDNTSVKVYQGEWEDDRYYEKGTFFDGDDSLAVETEDDVCIFKN